MILFKFIMLLRNLLILPDSIEDGRTITVQLAMSPIKAAPNDNGHARYNVA